MSRAVHGSVRVGFVTNPQSTPSDWVEKFQTHCRPRKATGRVGSGSDGRWSALISTEKKKIKHWSLIPEEQNQQIYNPKRRSTNPKNRSTNPQIDEPKRWNRKIESKRWRRRWAGTLRTKSEGWRRRAQIDDGDAEIDDEQQSRIGKG